MHPWPNPNNIDMLCKAEADGYLLRTDLEVSYTDGSLVPCLLFSVALQPGMWVLVDSEAC